MSTSWQQFLNPGWTWDQRLYLHLKDDNLSWKEGEEIEWVVSVLTQREALGEIVIEHAAEINLSLPSRNGVN